MVGGRILEYIPFQSILALCEVHTSQVPDLKFSYPLPTMITITSQVPLELQVAPYDFIELLFSLLYQQNFSVKFCSFHFTHIFF